LFLLPPNAGTAELSRKKNELKILAAMLRSGVATFELFCALCLTRIQIHRRAAFRDTVVLKIVPSCVEIALRGFSGANQGVEL